MKKINGTIYGDHQSIHPKAVTCTPIKTSILLDPFFGFGSQDAATS
jgi:hypothetical protein